MLNEIFNYVQLTDRVGTSGQPTADQFADIAAAGYKAVINLAMPDSTDALDNEGSLVSAQGMDYIHIPVPWEAPSADHLRRFFGAMHCYAGERVWVHCAMNLRVSAFMYHYLTSVENVPDEDATSPVIPRWEPQMDDTWREFLAMPRDQVSGLT